MTYSLFSAPYESVSRAFELARYYSASALLDPNFFHIPVRDGDSSFKKKFFEFFNKTVSKQQEKFFENQREGQLKGVYDASQTPPHPAKVLLGYAAKNAPQIIARAGSAFNPVLALQFTVLTLVAAGLADENIRSTISDQISYVAHYCGLNQDGPSSKTSAPLNLKEPSP